MRTICLALAGALWCGAQDNAPAWHSDVAAAFAEARRDRRPIFAVLHCPH